MHSHRKELQAPSPADALGGDVPVAASRVGVADTVARRSVDSDISATPLAGANDVDTRVLISLASGARRTPQREPRDDDLEWDSANDLGSSANGAPSLTGPPLEEVWLNGLFLCDCSCVLSAACNL